MTKDQNGCTGGKPCTFILVLIFGFLGVGGLLYALFIDTSYLEVWWIYLIFIGIAFVLEEQIN